MEYPKKGKKEKRKELKARKRLKKPEPARTQVILPPPLTELTKKEREYVLTLALIDCNSTS